MVDGCRNGCYPIHPSSHAHALYPCMHFVFSVVSAIVFRCRDFALPFVVLGFQIAR